VLDKHCIRCHDGSGDGKNGKKADKKSFDLRGLKMVSAPAPHDRDQGPQHAVSDSFLNLLRYVSYVKVGGHQGIRLPLAVGATGSRVSSLMKTLANGGHYKVKLPIGDWRAFAAWIDCNAPFYGGWDKIVIGKKAPRRRPKKPVVPPADQIKSAAERRKAIAGKLPSGAKLEAFLNCGVELTSDKKGAVRITQTSGSPWTLTKNKVPGVPATQRLISFDGKEVAFEVSGLKTGRSYSVALTWWDYNAAGRKQSVWVFSTDRRKGSRVVNPSDMPDYEKRKQPPAEISFELGSDQAQAGKCIIAVRNNAGANCVISEIWITSKKTGASK
jgi:hypothetical protein